MSKFYSVNPIEENLKRKETNKAIDQYLNSEISVYELIGQYLKVQEQLNND